MTGSAVTALHVIYRVDDDGAGEEWSAYSFPHSIYAGGSSLAETRDEFMRAAKLALGGLDQVTVIEHLEEQLIPGAYIRLALDRRIIERGEIAAIMKRSLAVPGQRDDFERQMPLAATGDAVVVACLPHDRLGWVFEQMNDHDALAVCGRGPVVGTAQSAWWSFISGPEAEVPGGPPLESLASAGLGADSTVSDFMRVNSTATGRSLATAVA
jgi:hypothetical protein